MRSDADLIEKMRASTAKYLDAIQAWESAYQKYYRVLAPGVSSDLEPEQNAYNAARRELERLLPQARRLCLKYSVRDPWPALLHVRLGARTPQDGFVTAIGRAERTLISQTLDKLESAARAQQFAAAEPMPMTNFPSQRNIIQRVFDFFF